MARTNILAIVALLSCGAVLAAPVRRIDPNNPPQGRFSDEWAEVYMAGGKVGYMHSTMNRHGNLIRTETTTKMRLGRADSPVAIAMVQRTTETVGGVPVSFGSEMHAAAMKTVTTGTVSDGIVTIVTSQYGMEQSQQFTYPVGAVMTWGQFRESLIHGFEPGTEYSIDVYAPELRLDDALKAVTKIGAWEDLTHAGRHRKGQRVTIEMATPMGDMTLTSWVDRDGWPIKAMIPAPGLGDMIIVTTDQATAQSDFLPPEIFLATTIKAKRKLDPKSTNRITYRIRATKPDVDLTGFPTTAMQSVIKRGDGMIEISVERRTRKSRRESGSVRAKNSSLTSKQLTEYLNANLMINTEDPKLIELAKRAGGGERDPYKLSDKLRRFVSAHVTTQSLGIGFATASEVCRTREGDCSEYGVLLAALGRIHKLPSRVVVGLAYVSSFAGREDFFGYHLWTQFYIDGSWVDVDAALRETVCSPTRIAFATSSLKHTGLADLSLPLISKIGAIDIDILEVE